MFELNIALRYLIPKKKALSTALISFLSVGVISLVVWLVLVFLSVTTGIERNWLEKLTSLHAPLRLTPTDHYYHSYYYQIDSLCSSSNYTLKTIGEKAIASHSDPYAENIDEQIPPLWPLPERQADGTLRDPVKELFTLLKQWDIPHQEYELSGALLRLSLERTTGAVLSQMSYLLSLPDQNPHFSSLLIPPSASDIDGLLQRAPHAKALRAILANLSIEEVEVRTLSPSLLPEGQKILAFAMSSPVAEVQIARRSDAETPPGWRKGWLSRHGTSWTWRSFSKTSEKVLQNPLLTLQEPLHLAASLIPPSIQDLTNIRLFVRGTLQSIPLQGEMYWEHASLTRASPVIKYAAVPAELPPWAIDIAGHCRMPSLPFAQPMLLPKSYQEAGVRLGDRGTLGFASIGSSSPQEQKIAVQVAGFYDPGLLSVGGRCLIVPKEVTHVIHTASRTFSPDGTPTNGIFAWPKDSDAARQMIEMQLQQTGLLPYWKVSTYENYEFSRELFQQFRSDRTLFLLIAILILTVACCNIISLLVLLVNDKKREIAILQAMGASRKSIAAIFGMCGLATGTLSCVIGTAGALFTLHHLDVIVRLLSAFQGHAAFQPAFFGQTLPNQLSTEALLFVCIATPLLSLVAGLIPAIRACHVHPSSALRQE